MANQCFPDTRTRTNQKSRTFCRPLDSLVRVTVRGFLRYSPTMKQNNDMNESVRLMKVAMAQCSTTQTMGPRRMKLAAITRTLDRVKVK